MLECCSHPPKPPSIRPAPTAEGSVMPINPRTPVLVGYGQVNYHETEGPENTPEPIDLMVSAAREAADARVLEAVDSVRVVNVLSVHYRQHVDHADRVHGLEHPRIDGLAGRRHHQIDGFRGV